MVAGFPEPLICVHYAARDDPFEARNEKKCFSASFLLCVSASLPICFLLFCLSHPFSAFFASLLSPFLSLLICFYLLVLFLKNNTYKKHHIN